MDERIVIRHLNLGRANQVDEFPVKMFKELTAGRDTTCEIKFDPDRDDLVSRRHAKITVDKTDPFEFSIQDLGSRNGTFVNKQRISNTVKLTPGDVVQFGAGGPEFQFDMEPRPASMAKATRFATEPMASAPAVPATRESAPPMQGFPGSGSAGMGSASGAAQMPPTTPQFQGSQQPYSAGGSPMPGANPSFSGSGQQAPHGVGKATVERMIVQGKTQTRNQMLLVGLLLLLLIGAVGGYFFWRSRSPVVDAEAQKKIDIVQKKMAEQGEVLTPTQVADRYADSVVLIEASWKLIDVSTGQQLNQVYIDNVSRNKEGKLVELIPNAPAKLPVFLTVSGALEPVLSTAERYGGHAIGSTHTGSGFVVSADGFILTNRHVAATWYTSYSWSDQIGLEIGINDDNEFIPKRGIPASQFPSRWVPAEAKVVVEGELSLQNARLKRKPIMGKALEGRNVYCDVTFQKNRIRIPAKTARTSDRIDVAMIKIDLPRTVKETRLYDNYNTIKPGDAITAMGYPAVSPEVVAVTGSKDVFNRNSEQKVIPEPTISVGNIGRVIRDGEQSASGEGTYSMFGDVYQLTINSTGAGNSGGPVFDDHGRVIGIFTSVRQYANASISFAVPIKYGMELMGVK